MQRLLILLFCLPLCSFAQESNLGNWWIYIGSKQIAPGWNLHHEIQYRNYNAIGDMEQLLLRTGVGRNLTQGNNNALFGYAYIISQNYQDSTADKTQVNEHRIFQQFITRQRFGRVGLQHRYRFEQRWVETDFRLRFRYFLAMTILLKKFEARGQSLYLSAYDEVFLNAENTIFDRNRLYGGLGYRLNKNIRVELGYMNQFFSVGGRDQVNVFVFANF